MRPHRVALLSLILATAVLATACGPTAPDAPPDVYRADECPYAVEIMDAWAGTGDEHWAVDVALRESRCQPDAYNRSGASGIFQLMMPLHARLIGDVCGTPAPFDPGCNIAAARALYDGAGRRPWNF